MDIYNGLIETEIRAVDELANKGSRSYGEIAEAVGISERQLFRIRQKPQVKKAIRERTIDALGEDMPEIMGQLRKKARTGDFRSIELIVKMMGLLVNQTEVKTTIEDNRFNEMSQDDIDAELAEIDNELKLIQGGAK